jgi:hypothetical protein
MIEIFDIVYDFIGLKESILSTDDKFNKTIKIFLKISGIDVENNITPSIKSLNNDILNIEFR